MRRWMSLLSFCLSCQRVPPAPAAKPHSIPEVADYSERLAPLRDELQVPALGGAVLDASGLRGLGVAGLRQVDGEESVQAGDIWHLGSDTKAMTATLAGILVEEGVVSWDTTVDSVWPDCDPSWQGVTLRALLLHRSGATDNIPGDHPDLWSDLWAASDEQVGRADFVQALLARPQDGTQGSFAYSNAGYIVAGAMLEEVTGQGWQALLQARVFAPLGMDDCLFGAPPSPNPWGHQRQGSRIVSVDPASRGSDNPGGLGPAGTVACSLSSWARFAGSHLRLAQGQDDLVTAETGKILHTPEGQYAFGWLVLPQLEGTVLVHSGSNTMWYATVVIAPEEDRAYLAVLNIAATGQEREIMAILEALRAADE